MKNTKVQLENLVPSDADHNRGRPSGINYRGFSLLNRVRTSGWIDNRGDNPIVVKADHPYAQGNDHEQWIKDTPIPESIRSLYGNSDAKGVDAAALKLALKDVEWVCVTGNTRCATLHLHNALCEMFGQPDSKIREITVRDGSKLSAAELAVIAAEENNREGVTPITPYDRILMMLKALDTGMCLSTDAKIADVTATATTNVSVMRGMKSIKRCKSLRPEVYDFVKGEFKRNPAAATACHPAEFPKLLGTDDDPMGMPIETIQQFVRTWPLLKSPTAIRDITPEKIAQFDAIRERVGGDREKFNDAIKDLTSLTSVKALGGFLEDLGRPWNLLGLVLKLDVSKNELFETLTAAGTDFDGTLVSVSAKVAEAAAQKKAKKA